MSRVPRSKEHLKTAFMAEAASAARFRAYARRADGEGLEQLASRWRELAAAKDELAIGLLEAAELVAAPERSLADAMAEERYENDVLYAKMIREVGEETADALRRVVEAQGEHMARLEDLESKLTAAAGRDLG